jgi:hypothetical protein
MGMRNENEIGWSGRKRQSPHTRHRRVGHAAEEMENLECCRLAALRYSEQADATDRPWRGSATTLGYYPPPPCFLEVVILRGLKLFVVYEICKCGF